MLATKRLSVLVACAAVALLLGVSNARAQQTSPQRTAPQQPMVAHGQLMRVDADAQTLTVKTTTGDSMVFRYTDSTKVSGAQERIEGLATMTGATVTVQYTGSGSNLVATAIDVQAKK